MLGGTPHLCDALANCALRVLLRVSRPAGFEAPDADSMEFRRNQSHPVPIKRAPDGAFEFEDGATDNGTSDNGTRIGQDNEQRLRSRLHRVVALWVADGMTRYQESEERERNIGDLPADIEAQRVAFEAWVCSLSRWKPASSARKPIFERCKTVPALYADRTIDLMWMGWLGRAGIDRNAL